MRRASSSSSPARSALAARDWGEPGGERVLALHGWLDNAASFDALAPLHPRRRRPRRARPARPRPLAAPPEGCWYHYVDYPGDVLHVADALGWERFTLLGHSLGGAIASVIAAVAPERVEALWLIEALGPPAADAVRTRWSSCAARWSSAMPSRANRAASSRTIDDRGRGAPSTPMA